jgi:hypothetical protein
VLSGAVAAFAGLPWGLMKKNTNIELRLVSKFVLQHERKGGNVFFSFFQLRAYVGLALQCQKKYKEYVC